MAAVGLTHMCSDARDEGTETAWISRKVSFDDFARSRNRGASLVGHPRGFAGFSDLRTCPPKVKLPSPRF